MHHRGEEKTKKTELGHFTKIVYKQKHHIMETKLIPIKRNSSEESAKKGMRIIQN